jgi:hypothetical protein
MRCDWRNNHINRVLVSGFIFLLYSLSSPPETFTTLSAHIHNVFTGYCDTQFR